MRRIVFIALLALALVPEAGRAQALSGPAMSTSTICYPVTVSNVSPSTMTVVDSTSSISLPQVISIQNQDGSHAIYCSSDAAVATSGAHLGWDIADNNTSRDFTLLGTEQWYCLAASASVQSVVCKTH